MRTRVTHKNGRFYPEVFSLVEGRYLPLRRTMFELVNGRVVQYDVDSYATPDAAFIAAKIVFNAKTLTEQKGAFICRF